MERTVEKFIRVMIETDVLRLSLIVWTAMLAKTMMQGISKNGRQGISGGNWHNANEGQHDATLWDKEVTAETIGMRAWVEGWKNGNRS